MKKKNEAIYPGYTYPRDWEKILVREADTPGARWMYLGTVVRHMRQRREDKSMMSANNFKKRWGHRM